MKRQSLEAYDDDAYDDETELPLKSVDENKATEGNELLKRRFKNTVDGATGPANRLDTEIYTGPEIVDDRNVTEIRRLKFNQDNAEAKTDPELPRLVAPKIVKQRNKQRLATAVKEFGPIPEVKPVNTTIPPAAVNDNDVGYKIEESWHIRDQITRGNLDRDLNVKARLLATLQRLRKDCDAVDADGLASSVHRPGREATADFDLQRDQYGNVVYENGQTLDRKKIKQIRQDGVDEDVHAGAVRKASKSGVTHGFDVYRDDPHAFALIAARNNIDEAIVAAGPLWQFLKLVVRGNPKSAEIGYMLGKTDPQASGVGNMIIKLALEAVAGGYDRIDERESSSENYAKWLGKQPDALPVPARRLKAALKNSHDGPPSNWHRQSREDRIPASHNEMQRAKAAAP
jgi:hypothetical protein